MGTQLQGWPSSTEDLAAALIAGERRRDQRHITVLQVAKLVTHHFEEYCIVRDVSSGGLKAEVYCRLEVRDRVWVEFKNGHQVAGRVAWAEDHFAGIAFDQSIDTDDLLTRRDTNLEGQRPRAPRLGVVMAGTLRVDGERVPVRVTDVSQDGCGLSGPLRLKPGSGCEIELPGLGYRLASVRWFRDGEAGLMFHERLSYRDFALWRHRLATAARAPRHGVSLA